MGVGFKEKDRTKPAVAGGQQYPRSYRKGARQRWQMAKGIGLACVKGERFAYLFTKTFTLRKGNTTF